MGSPSPPCPSGLGTRSPPGESRGTGRAGVPDESRQPRPGEVRGKWVLTTHLTSCFLSLGGWDLVPHIQPYLNSDFHLTLQPPQCAALGGSPTSSQVKGKRKSGCWREAPRGAGFVSLGSACLRRDLGLPLGSES